MTKLYPPVALDGELADATNSNYNVFGEDRPGYVYGRIEHGVAGNATDGFTRHGEAITNAPVKAFNRLTNATTEVNLAILKVLNSRDLVLNVSARAAAVNEEYEFNWPEVDPLVDPTPTVCLDADIPEDAPTIVPIIPDEAS